MLLCYYAIYIAFHNVLYILYTYIYILYLYIYVCIIHVILHTVILFWLNYQARHTYPTYPLLMLF